MPTASPARGRWLPSALFRRVVLWVLVAALMVSNVVMMLQLNAARKIAQRFVTDLVGIVAALEELEIQQTIVVDEELPIHAEVPIDESIAVPLQATIPIDTVVTIGVNAGILGTIPLSIPIQADVPVDFELELPFQKTVEFDTSVPVYLELPIAVSLADSPIMRDLAAARRALEEIAALLARPLLPMAGVGAE
jgi:sporulation-control protein spo0M